MKIEVIGRHKNFVDFICQKFDLRNIAEVIEKVDDLSHFVISPARIPGMRAGLFLELTFPPDREERARILKKLEEDYYFYIDYIRKNGTWVLLWSSTQDVNGLRVTESHEVRMGSLNEIKNIICRDGAVYSVRELVAYSEGDEKMILDNYDYDEVEREVYTSYDEEDKCGATEVIRLYKKLFTADSKFCEIVNTLRERLIEYSVDERDLDAIREEEAIARYCEEREKYTEELSDEAKEIAQKLKEIAESDYSELSELHDRVEEFVRENQEVLRKLSDEEIEKISEVSGICLKFFLRNLN